MLTNEEIAINLLKEVMVWIDNWDSNFCDDPEWIELEERIKKFLKESEIT